MPFSKLTILNGVFRQGLRDAGEAALEAGAERLVRLEDVLPVLLHEVGVELGQERTRHHLGYLFSRVLGPRISTDRKVGLKKAKKKLFCTTKTGHKAVTCLILGRLKIVAFSGRPVHE